MNSYFKLTICVFVILQCLHIHTVHSKDVHDIVKEADKDGDGKLNQAESLAYLTKTLPPNLSQETIKAEIAKLDKNHDGFLTAEEIDPPKNSKDVHDIVKEADKDGDGKLNQAESLAYLTKTLPNLSQETIKAEITKLDKNHDGFLTAEEIDPPSFTTTTTKPKSQG
ncbi:uncharacterized protein LOC135835939 [Planococcus citri]|uniref:uncharacterized protein LOC135835939 n=1 Tax=Planococcus citri TaxID=170843 RepID=UPI0031F904C8